ncbi:hypothetical protein Tco_0788714 [Tanacetum coccineum]
MERNLVERLPFLKDVFVSLDHPLSAEALIEPPVEVPATNVLSTVVIVPHSGPSVSVEDYENPDLVDVVPKNVTPGPEGEENIDASTGGDLAFSKLDDEARDAVLFRGTRDTETADASKDFKRKLLEQIECTQDNNSTSLELLTDTSVTTSFREAFTDSLSEEGLFSLCNSKHAEFVKPFSNETLHEKDSHSELQCTDQRAFKTFHTYKDVQLSKYNTNARENITRVTMHTLPWKLKHSM